MVTQKTGRLNLWGNVERSFSSETYKGHFISICGLDGAGKTTQVSALEAYFNNLGKPVLVTKQPTKWYREDLFVRAFLEQGGSSDQARILALFAAADRLRHISEVIQPALARGELVITDRYVYSSLAYFSARGIPQDFIVYINHGIPRPDHAFFLDVRPAELLRRLKARDGRNLQYEERRQDILSKIRELYIALSDELVVIDGELPAVEITRSMVEIITAGNK